MAGRSSWPCLPEGFRGCSSPAGVRMPLLGEMSLLFALFAWRNVTVSQSVACQRGGCAFLSVNQVRSELRCLGICRVGSFKNTFLLHLFSVCALERTHMCTQKITAQDTLELRGQLSGIQWVLGSEPIFRRGVTCRYLLSHLTGPRVWWS